MREKIIQKLCKNGCTNIISQKYNTPLQKSRPGAHQGNRRQRKPQKQAKIALFHQDLLTPIQTNKNTFNVT